MAVHRNFSQHIKLNTLTHFSPMLHFYTPWKRQKNKGFLTFSEGIERKHWAKDQFDIIESTIQTKIKHKDAIQLQKFDIIHQHISEILRELVN